MATEDIKQEETIEKAVPQEASTPTPSESTTPGESTLQKTEDVVVPTPEEERASEEYPILTSLDPVAPDKPDEEKKYESTGVDFYDAYLGQRELLKTATTLKSADSYWENRPEERQWYTEKYGDKAREEFDKKYYEKIEPESWGENTYWKSRK